MPNDPPTKRYQFVVGKGDLSRKPAQPGPRSGWVQGDMMLFDASGNSQIVDRMKKET